MDELRELVANTIMSHPSSRVEDIADALIQALTEAGALLPALPENVSRVHCYLTGAGWTCFTYHEGEGKQQGSELTFPAALADALGQDGP